MAPIRTEDKTDLYTYLGGIIRQTGSTAIIINGTENHVHVLARLSKNISVSSFVNRDIHILHGRKDMRAFPSANHA